jgi:hypothetical protein
MRLSGRIFGIFGILLALGWILYFLFGDFFIQAAYDGKAPALLSRLIEGQNAHPPEFYQELALRFMKKMSVAAFALCIFLIISLSFSRYLPKMNPDLLALLGGVLFCIILIAFVEVALRLYAPQKSNVIERFYSPDYWRSDEFGIIEAKPGQYRSFLKNLKNDQFTYDVTYAIDEYGRRITPIDKGDRDRFILFFGCSFTYGEGVHNDQTLPYYVGRLATQHTPYNYGYHGLGPFDALAKIESIDFKNEVRETQGIIIYTFMPDHLNRLMGSMSTMAWHFNGAYYRKSAAGKLVRNGDFKTGRPIRTRLYTLLSKSRILEALKINLPPKIGDYDLKFFVQTCQAMDTIIKEKFPRSAFYVVIYPGTDSDRLVQYLKEGGIKYLDYTQLFDRSDPKFYLSEDDHHPAPLAYQLVAEQIVKDLHLDEK